MTRTGTGAIISIGTRIRTARMAGRSAHLTVRFTIPATGTFRFLRATNQEFEFVFAFFTIIFVNRHRISDRKIR